MILSLSAAPPSASSKSYSSANCSSRWPRSSLRPRADSAAHPPNVRLTAEVERQVTDFLLDRARFILSERHGFAYDEINAALAAGSDDLVDAVERISAVRAIRKTKNFEPLAVSFKRIRNILEKAGPPNDWRLPAVRPDLFHRGRGTQAAFCRLTAWPGSRSSIGARDVTAKPCKESRGSGRR